MSQCLICFYTAENKPIELGLTPHRAGSPSDHLNFDFTQPLNGKLNQISDGMIYSPTQNFVGNDTFIIQIQNKSAPSGYSTLQVKMVVVARVLEMDTNVGDIVAIISSYI